MCEKVFLGLLLVRLQGGIENGLEARGSCGCGWCLGHDRSCDRGGIEMISPQARVGMMSVNTPGASDTASESWSGHVTSAGANDDRRVSALALLELKERKTFAGAQTLNTSLTTVRS